MEYSDLEIKKIEKIKSILIEKMKDQQEETLVLPFKFFLTEPLLKNQEGLEKILTIIQEKTSNRISWKIRQQGFSFQRAGDVDSPYPKIMQAPVGIEIHVLDPNNIDYYFSLVLKTEESNVVPLTKYNNQEEEIRLKKYGITIKGKSIYKKGVKPYKAFNATDESLIYFLYYKHLSNQEECFLLNNIAVEVDRAEKSLKNSITNIHNSLSKFISGNNRSSIKVRLIKNESSERGYRLDPTIFKT
jgi:hypothetical protein